MTALPDLLEDDALAIFLFHGVIPAARPGVRNYTGKHLPADEFRAMCAGLAEHGTPVGADDAVAMLRGERPLPPRAFLVSFDDGFANNLTVAAPILAALGVPAVFYVTTSFVGAGGASWIDLIEEAVERFAGSELALPWDGGAPRPAGTRAERVALLDEVRRVVKGSPALDPYAVADDIRARAGVGPFVPDPDLDAKLSWAQVRALAAPAGFTVGGHSHTHRILAFLDPDELAEELDVSLRLLGAALGEPVRHYSYPEGLAHCYSPAVIAALRERGVVCCPTALPGANPVGTDLFELRRHLVA